MGIIISFRNLEWTNFALNRNLMMELRRRIFIFVSAMVSLSHAFLPSMLIFEFYDTIDPVHREVGRYCRNKNNTERNLCELLRQYDGPCKDEIDKRSCIYRQCDNAKMSTMPLCKKYRRSKRLTIQRSMPLFLRIFNLW